MKSSIFQRKTGSRAIFFMLHRWYVWLLWRRSDSRISRAEDERVQTFQVITENFNLPEVAFFSQQPPSLRRRRLVITALWRQFRLNRRRALVTDNLWLNVHRVGRVIDWKRRPWHVLCQIKLYDYGRTVFLNYN